MTAKPLLLSLLLLPGLLCAAERDLVFVATDGASMPLAEISGGVVVAGIMKDVGDAIAHGLGRKARHIAVPRNRMLMMLGNGEADGICYARPEWYGTQGLNWTRPLIPSGNVVATLSAARRPLSLDDLAGKPIGAVLGYKYPELDAALGKRFIRDDAPNSELNFRKLSAGRVEHAVLDTLNLAWRLKIQHPPLALHPNPLVTTSFTAQCAFSVSSDIPFAEIERVVDTLLQTKRIERILDKYR